MRLKKIAAAVLSLSLFCGAVPFSNVYMNDYAVYAESEYTEGTYGGLSYHKYSDHIGISDNNSTATSIVIPDMIDGLPVTTILNYAFSYSKNLNSIVLPDSIEHIGDYAFANCESLSSIIIPENVKFIGQGGFLYCTNLKSAKLPSRITYISDHIFQQCFNLTSITIPDSVICIYESAFYACEQLKQITIPNSVTSIESNSFAYCKNLTSITIKNRDCSIYDSCSTISNNNNYFDDYYNGTICGYENSTAQAYAEKYGYKFESLGEYVETILGDTDGDGVINSSDASNVLAAYALIATGGQSPFTAEQTKAADVNNDGAVDSSDASSILAYYAYTATGGKDTLEEFLG